MERKLGRSFFLILLLICTLVLSPVASVQLYTIVSAATYTTGSYTIVASGGLRLREGPSTSSAQVALIPNGSTVSVSKIEGEWGYTTYSGKSGWISMAYTKKLENTNPTADINVRIAAEKVKFPNGRYYSHTPGQPNNPDATSTTPCSHHSGGCGGYKGDCGCNSFNGLAIQCHGFACKLGYDVFGLNPYTGWTKIYSAADIRVGDIVRYRNNGHSIFITGISGDTFTYADCNADGKCRIRWDATVTRATLTSTFTYVWRANNYDEVVPPSPNKLDAVKITLSATEYVQGNAATLSFASSKATQYKLVITAQDGSKMIDITTAETKYSCKLDPGFYSAKVTAINSEGSLDSEPVNFAVYATRKDNIGSDFYAVIRSADGSILTNAGTATRDSERRDASQVLHFLRRSDGTYSITSQHDGTCLNVLEAGYINGTSVVFAPLSGANEQSWRIEDQGSGQYVFGVQCAPETILSVSEGTAQYAGELQLWEKPETGPQSFAIEKISPVSTLTLSTSSLWVAPDKTIALSGYLTVVPSNAYNTTLLYTSSNTSVATVSAKGVITGKKEGTAKITAKSVDGLGKTAVVTVIVSKQKSTYVTMRIGYTKAIQNSVKTTVDTVGTRPFTISGRTMLPLRFLGEKLGGKVTYVNDSTPIKMTYGNMTVEFTLGKSSMKVSNGSMVKTLTMDVNAQKKGGKTYIPLRAVAEALGFDVRYQEGTKLIVVSNVAMDSNLLTQRFNEGIAYIK